MMSYKDYSEEAVKEILRKVSQSSRKEQDAGSHELTPRYPEKSDKESGFDAGYIQIKDYAYNHPTSSEINRLTDTHIIIEKWFESEISEETIWDKIVTELKEYFGVERKSSKIVNSSSGIKWSYISHSNHETIVRLKKTGRFTSLKIIQRLGFWKPQIEGIIHGSYTSLILFGILYVIFKPSLLLSIGVFALLWAVVSLIIYRFSVSSRKKKQADLTDFAGKLTNQFKLRS